MDNPTNNPIINLIESHGKLARRQRKHRAQLRLLRARLQLLQARIEDLELIQSEAIIASIPQPRLNEVLTELGAHWTAVLQASAQDA